MTDLFGDGFVMSDALKERFKRAENKSATAVSVEIHRGIVPPVTQATTNDTPIPDRYPILVGDDGARMYAPFEETSGLVVYDAIRLINTGTYLPSVVHIAGEIFAPEPFSDHAIRTVEDDSVVIASNAPLAEGSWEIGVRTSETVGVPTVIGSLVGNGGGVGLKIRMLLNPDGTLTFGFYDAGEVLQYSDGHPTVVNDGQWHYVVAVDTGTTLEVYVDGSLT